MKFELINDHFENAKRYNIPRAQLIIADIPYNLGNNAYASDPRWYKDGDNKNGESRLAGKSFFDTDNDFKINNFFDFCSRLLKKEPKEKGKAPNPVTLRPYRTFSEVEQPASLFVFRIDKQANMALFEADGKHWVADAVGNIAAYLKEQLADQKHITVLA